MPFCGKALFDFQPMRVYVTRSTGKQENVMNHQLKILFFSLAALLAATAFADKTSWQERARSRKNVSKAAQELNDMARGTRVARNVRDHLENQGQAINYSLKQEQLTGSELRQIDSIRRNIEKYLDRIEEEGELTRKDAQKLYAEISRGYRLLWFLRRNNTGKRARMSILGKEIALKEDYQKKVDKNSLTRDEMADILKAYYKAFRIRDRMQMISLSAEQKLKMERTCFNTLSEYFEIIEK